MKIKCELKSTMIGNTLEEKILHYLYHNLLPKRNYHTLCVTELAVKLARYYNENVYNIQTAALLHDCAKEMSLNQMRKYIEKNNLKIPHYNFVVSVLPQVLHSYIGSDIAKKKFGIKNEIILNAIKHHTIGRVGMSNCEKILFVADALSEDRKYKNKYKYNKILFDGLDTIFKLVLYNKINYVISNFKTLHPDIVSIWNYYNTDNL